MKRIHSSQSAFRFGYQNKIILQSDGEDGMNCDDGMEGDGNLRYGHVKYDHGSKTQNFQKRL